MGTEEAKIPPWAEGEDHKEDPKSKSIINKVLDKLGKPKNLLKCVVKNVYGNRYRVNIIVSKESDLVGFKPSETSDSFFLHISPEGEITYANPPIVRRY